MILREFCSFRVIAGGTLTLIFLALFISENIIIPPSISSQYDSVHQTGKTDLSTKVYFEGKGMSPSNLTRESSDLNSMVNYQSQDIVEQISTRTQRLSHNSNLTAPRNDKFSDNSHANKEIVARLQDSCSHLNISTRLYDVPEINALCRYAISRPVHSSDSMNTSFLMSRTVGRLGNQMFLLASSIGIAHAQGKAVCLPENSLLLDLFSLENLNKINWSESETWLEAHEQSWGRFDPCLFHLPKNHSTVGTFLQSYKYFHHIDDKIRDLFRIRDDVLAKAAEILNSLWSQQSYSWNKTTVVAVHVRRGDMLYEKTQALGHVAAPRSYYRKAFQWMVDALPDKEVVFVVVSEEISWCEKFLGGSFVKIAPRAPAVVHLALLASCDHVIMSTGTFGWWGAWLARGKVVYYKNYPARNSVLAQGFSEPDFFLQNWVGLE